MSDLKSENSQLKRMSIEEIVLSLSELKIVRKKVKGKNYDLIIFIPWMISGIWVLGDLQHFMGGIDMNLGMLFIFAITSIAVVFYALFTKWDGINGANHEKMIEAFENNEINEIIDLEMATGLSRSKIMRLLKWYEENGWLVKRIKTEHGNFSKEESVT